MSNMSYCRFQNTRSDFQDCVFALEDMIEDSSKLSKEEERAAKGLYDLALEYIDLSETYQDANKD